MEKGNPVVPGSIRSLALGLCFFFLLQGACSAQHFVRVFLPDGKAVTAELAVTPEERARGLMFRASLGPEEGMLFVFEEEGFYSFWMKNMVLSLDILWLDKEKRIVHIERRVPPCKAEPCPTYTPPIPAMYVLELREGSVESRGLKMFDRLDFLLPNAPRNRSS